MLILNYYQTSTQQLKGFAYDTNNMTYKKFCLESFDWQNTIHAGRNDIVYEIKSDFKLPSDIDYYFTDAKDLDVIFTNIIRAGFTEDSTIVLNFGCITV
jgi:hypothetical protein